MKRARPSSMRRDSASVDGSTAARRPLMEHIHPLQSHSRRHHDSRGSRSSKRTRLSEPSSSSRPPLPPHSSPHFVYAPNRYMDVDKLLKARSERVVTVHLPSDHFTLSNAAIRNRFLWGTDAYTDDSDLVAVLVHTGFATLESKPTFEYLSVKLKLQRHVPKASLPFTASERFGLSSRAWSSSYNGARMSVQSVQAVAADRKFVKRRHTPVLSTVPIPGIVVAGRAPVPKATKSALRKPAPVICFDMLNKPCQIYNINQVTSLNDDERSPIKRLQREVMYVENDMHRYEVSRVNNRHNVVRFGQVRNTAVMQEMLAELGLQDKVECPMRKADLANVQELPWNELDWDTRGVTVKGDWYPLTKLSFQKLRE